MIRIHLLPVLVDVGVRLHVAVEHALVDTRVVALVTLERFRAEVVTKVVLQVVLVLRDEGTLGALETLVVLDVAACVLPVLLLEGGRERGIFLEIILITLLLFFGVI